MRDSDALFIASLSFFVNMTCIWRVVDRGDVVVIGDVFRGVGSIIKA